jgi:hypothetical protein
MSNLSAIVRAYITRYRRDAEKELRWFAIQPTLSDAVSLAALAQRPSGKRLDHQRRIPRAVLEQSRWRLLRTIKRLEGAASFEEFYNIVESRIGDILNGTLTCFQSRLTMRFTTYGVARPSLVCAVQRRRFPSG